jgi:hypothetical protein
MSEFTVVIIPPKCATRELQEIFNCANNETYHIPRTIKTIQIPSIQHSGTWPVLMLHYA